MKVLLQAGGWSSERAVSLSGAEGVRAALENLGHTVEAYDPAVSLGSLAEVVADKDFVFVMLHGSPGEDGIIQAVLDRLDRPYQGSGPAASMLALNKAFAKILFASAGLTTAPWQLLYRRSGAESLPLPAYPLFIKADTGGSSLHMERVERHDDLPAALDRLFSAGGSYLAESAVDGLEVTCGVLGELAAGEEVPRALPPILIRPFAGKIFDYAGKYSSGGAEEICPAPISARLTERIQDMALAAHRVLGLSGYSRADFIVPADECPVLLEVNSLPGMTRTSLLPQAAAACGLSFDRLVERLVELGLARKRRTG
ncbi:MAG: D-alanine--D-alanine ligase [Desulfovibrio sp.]|jgi:D-alanine-D-alanine ligase|nr:D-alanine--D-alanine ligase [Desulfovibrio sp.]